jgi:hypothetical protein
MIFAAADDGMALVFEDVAHVRRECEAVDVESEVFVFYAEDGTWLRPEWVRPNRRRVLLGIEPGHFELVPDPNRERAVDPIEVALAECVGVEPNPHFGSVAEILAHVVEQRQARI